MIPIVDIRNTVAIDVLRIDRVVVVMVAAMIQIIIIMVVITISVSLHQWIAIVDYQWMVEHPVIIEVVRGGCISTQKQRDIPQIDSLTLCEHQASMDFVVGITESNGHNHLIGRFFSGFHNDLKTDAGWHVEFKGVVRRSVVCRIDGIVRPIITERFDHGSRYGSENFCACSCYWRCGSATAATTIATTA